MKYTFNELKQGYNFWFLVIGILFVLSSFGCLISNAESYGYTTTNFPDEYYNSSSYPTYEPYENNYKVYNSSIAIYGPSSQVVRPAYFRNIYFSISSPYEVVSFVGYGSNDVFGSFGFCSQMPDGVSGGAGYFNSYYMNTNSYSFTNNELVLDSHYNYRVSNNYQNYNGHNYCYIEYSNISTQSYPYDYDKITFDIPINMKVFESREYALNYLKTGDLDGLVENPTQPDPEEPIIDNSITLDNFSVKTYDSADFDNFYFDFRYDLSDEIKNNLDDAILEATVIYNGTIVNKLTQKADSFNSPYSDKISIPLNLRQKGFPSKLNTITPILSYLDDSVSFLGSRPEHKMKRLLIGIDDNWFNYVGGQSYRVDKSTITYTLVVIIDGRKSQPYVFNYDFVKKSGNTVVPDSDNPDVPVDTPSDTIPDGTDVDGNGVINSVDINNIINISINDGDSLYYDIEPEDYNNLIDNIGNAINPQKDNGLFALLKDFLADFPIELKLCLIGSLSAIAIVSIVKILRG